ncbi:MAG TPA: hypothetical protein G4O04_01435 [Anaerolineae bacterium]|nr:hypothetical protein [Anaerolineae bacterium]HID85456.1 hypothetical protein [Anaerolineales bacterium]HIQ09547.1 hypothetical protein [Anaerolineaceae bacterium]
MSKKRKRRRLTAPSPQARLPDPTLDPPGTHPEPYEIEFGRDGKPVYVAGPYHPPWFVDEVLSTLERTAPGSYHFVVPLAEDDLPEDLLWAGEEDAFDTED